MCPSSQRLWGAAPDNVTSLSQRPVAAPFLHGTCNVPIALFSGVTQSKTFLGRIFFPSRRTIVEIAWFLSKLRQHITYSLYRNCPLAVHFARCYSASGLFEPSFSGRSKHLPTGAKWRNFSFNIVPCRCKFEGKRSESQSLILKHWRVWNRED